MARTRHMFPSSPAGLFMTGALIPIAGGITAVFITHIPSGGWLAALALWLAFIITILVAILVAINVSAIHAAEQMLQKNHDELNAIISSIREGLLVINADGRITTINAAAAQLLGIQQGATGSPFIRDVLTMNKKNVALNPQDSPIVRALAICEPVRTILSDDISIDGGGGRIPIVGIASPLINANGSCVGAVWIFEDASREKRSDRYKTEFISLASHQLKTPLAIINWYSKLLLIKGKKLLNKNLLDYAEHILHGGNRLVSLINKLITIASIEEGAADLRLVPVDAIKTIRSVIDECVPLAKKKNGTIRFISPKRGFSVLADPILLYQSLLNIIVNAIRYSKPKHCTVHVSLSRSTDDMCIISVRDSGIGIPEEAQSRIFEKFYRAHNAIDFQSDGSGLGLYISKRFAGLMNGNLTFESRKGRGTTFHLELPLAP